MSLRGNEKALPPIQVEGLIIYREQTAYSKIPDYDSAARIIFNHAMVLPADRQEKYDTGSSIHGGHLLMHVQTVIRDAGYEDVFSLALSVNKHILYVRRA